MKNPITILMLFLIVLNISCKNNAEQPVTQDLKKEVIVPKHLTINFSFKTNKADVFNIMMNNIEVDELQKKNIHIFEDVAPSSGLEAIIAEFDEGNISKNIVFNLGNKEIKEVKIKSILVSYGSNQININTPKDFDKYLVFNKFIERDSTSSILKTKRIDNNHRPSFWIKRVVINQLK